MAQQTAVEWLQERYNRRQVYEESIYDEEFDQAKAMEKEQIINSYISGDLMEGRANLIDAEQYYNETYNNSLKQTK
jgi:hypothetical protein